MFCYCRCRSFIRVAETFFFEKRWETIRYICLITPMAAPEKNSFTCPNCGALYEVTKVEASVPTVAMQISCRECGAPFNRREGKFAVKYRFVRKSGNNAAN
jgi:hypothetical protein